MSEVSSLTIPFWTENWNINQKSFKKEYYTVDGITVHPLDDAEQLRQKLVHAKKRLHDLKQNNVVFARTRTVTRLLDNVRLSGNSRNVTESATREELIDNAIEITKLRDSIDEKTRELTVSQGLLAEKDRVLYDLRAQLEDLKAKSEQDFDFSQTHVAEHANRNANLSLRCKSSSLFPKILICKFSD